MAYFVKQILKERNLHLTWEVFKKEISAGIELSLVGLIHAKNLLQGRRNPAPITDQIIERYRDVWLIRARPGGLEESLSLLNSAIKRISIRNQN